jgi:RNA polymerase sigma factor (sigma-70 family)
MNQCTSEPMTAQAVEQAMKQHDGLVHAFIQRQGGGDIPYEEALQAGRIGLWRAIQGYDPARGTTFSTYAWVAIYRGIHRRAKELSRDTDGWLQDLSASGGMPDPVEGIDRERTHDALHDLVNRLPQRLGWVIVRRYGLWGEAPCTLKELGKEMGLSGERVRQLQQEALAWLRHPAHSWHLRQLLGKNRATDYRQALAQNAALRRARRRRS